MNAFSHALDYSPEDNRHDLRQFLCMSYLSFPGLECLILIDLDPPFTWAYKKMLANVEFWESKGWTTGKGQKKSVKAD